MNRALLRQRTTVCNTGVKYNKSYIQTNNNCENAVFRTKTQARQMAQIVSNNNGGILADRRNIVAQTTTITHAEAKPPTVFHLYPV
jgi:hypothetical protein